LLKTGLRQLWLAGLSFNQRIGGSIPALVDVSLSKTLNPDLLPVAELCLRGMNVRRFGALEQVVIMWVLLVALGWRPLGYLDMNEHRQRYIRGKTDTLLYALLANAL